VSDIELFGCCVPIGARGQPEGIRQWGQVRMEGNAQVQEYGSLVGDDDVAGLDVSMDQTRLPPQGLYTLQQGIA
jgi:hypothetical protein